MTPEEVRKAFEEGRKWTQEDVVKNANETIAAVDDVQTLAERAQAEALKKLMQGPRPQGR